MYQPVIDMHNHLMPDENALSDYERAADQLGIKKIVFHGLEWPGVNFSKNTAIKRAMKMRPDLIVGFGGINLWEDIDPERIDRLRDEGFSGLKFIIPPEPYNSERFYPYYDRAEKNGMPILFHLGIVSSEWTKKVRVDNNMMRPIYLDTIARSFRDLTIIGAHLGNPWYEEATMCCRWNQHLYFDLTGSTLKKKKSAFLRELLWWNRFSRYRGPDMRDAWEKIVFGSDVAYYETHDVLHDYDVVISELNLSDEIRWKIMGGTAAEMYGL